MRRSRAKATAESIADAAEIVDARVYYRKILPFYEKESVSRAHLKFWRGIARRTRPRNILEIGAGLGRITAELSRVAPAVGLDVCLEMLAVARGHGAPHALFVAADARRVTFRRAFDLIVAPGDPISHMTTLADRRRALRAVARQLAPRGLFVLEGLTRRRNRVTEASRRIRHAEGVLRIEETWVPMGGKDLWHARYRYSDKGRDGSVRTMSAGFFARAWDSATIRDFFESCGLEIVDLWGDFDRRPAWRGAPRIVLFARPARVASAPRSPRRPRRNLNRLTK